MVPTIGTVSGVLDRHDDAGSEHELLPGLGKVDHVQSVRAALPDVRDLKSSQTTSARHNRAHEVKHARRDTARGKGSVPPRKKAGLHVCKLPLKLFAL